MASFQGGAAHFYAQKARFSFQLYCRVGFRFTLAKEFELVLNRYVAQRPFGGLPWRHNFVGFLKKKKKQGLTIGVLVVRTLQVLFEDKMYTQ